MAAPGDRQFVHNRVLKQFDFEEGKLGNFESMPMHWYVMGRTPRTQDQTFLQYPYHRDNVGRQGYPGYAEVGFNIPQSEKGNHSLQLTSEGGNVGAFVEIGVLPVIPGSDYLIVAKIRTQALRHANAELAAFFLDAHGNKIKASIRTTGPIRTHSQWQRVTIRLPSILKKNLKQKVDDGNSEGTEAGPSGAVIIPAKQVQRMKPIRAADHPDGPLPEVASRKSLPVTTDGGAWVGLEFQLKQPRLNDIGKDLTVGEVVYHDVKARAWLDDLVIWQVPRVSIETRSQVNMLDSGGSKPEIRFDVQDLTGRHLMARTTIYDLNLNPLHDATQDIGGGDPSKWRWSPPITKAGWYLVELKVIDRNKVAKKVSEMAKSLNIPSLVKKQPVKKAETKEKKPPEEVAKILSAFAILPPGHGSKMLNKDMARFGISAESADSFALNHLPELMHRTRLGHATVSSWEVDTNSENVDVRAAILEHVLTQLADRGHPIHVSLFPVPGELLRGRQLQPDVADALFDVSMREIEPFLMPIIRPLGQRITAWQTGSTHVASSFYRRSLPDALARFEQKLSQLVATPQIFLPWDAMQSPREDLSNRSPYVLRIPTGIRPENFSEQLKGFKDQMGGRMIMELVPYAATDVSQQVRVEDFARRVIYGWREQPAALQVERPWTKSAQAKQTLVPDPILPVYAHLASHLAGRQFVGELPLGEGVHAWVFDRSRRNALLKTGIQSRISQRESLLSGSDRGIYSRSRFQSKSQVNSGQDAVLIVWSDSEQAMLRRLYRNNMDEFALYLGQKPKGHDLFGNEIALAQRGDGKHVIPVSTAPMVITGVNPHLARLRLAFKMDKPFLVSKQIPQLRQVTLHNPWPVNMSGSLVVTDPNKWKITPQQVPISIGPGQKLNLPFSMLFPASETAGKKQFIARLRFATDLQYVIDATIPFEVGLPYVKMDAEIIYEPSAKGGNPDDVVVSQVIQNTGIEPRSLYCYAYIKGFARQEKVISNLKPGDSVVRRFRFPAAAEVIQKEDVRVGLRETNGPAVLNMIVKD